MRASILFLSLLPVITSFPINPSSSTGLRVLQGRNGSHWPHVPRLILYVQNQANVDGSPLSLLPLLEEKTRVTHIIVSSFHVNRAPHPITLNDDPPDSEKYDNLVCGLLVWKRDTCGCITCLSCPFPSDTRWSGWMSQTKQQVKD
jgi:hypothetical protein